MNRPIGMVARLFPRHALWVAADPASGTGGDDARPRPAVAGPLVRLAEDQSPAFVYDGFRRSALNFAWKF
jgi:hypothetical protein